MRNSVYVVLLSLMLPLSHVWAGSGSEGGGGGSRVESAFRLTATLLVDQVSKNVTANKLCSANIIQAGLNSSQIRVVDTLIDGHTNNPIEDQHLDAWTRPGLIQLRLDSWIKYLRSDDSLDTSVYALILHELYRTTTACDDDTGALSTAVIGLLRNPTKPDTMKFDKLFTFKFRASNWKEVYQPGLDTDDRFAIEAAACDSQVDFAKPVPKVHCVIAGKSLGRIDYYIQLVETTSDRKMPYTVVAKAEIPWYGIGFERLYGIYNMINIVSLDQPFYMTVNAQTGRMHIGADLSNMAAP